MRDGGAREVGELGDLSHAEPLGTGGEQREHNGLARLVPKRRHECATSAKVFGELLAGACAELRLCLFSHGVSLLWHVFSVPSFKQWNHVQV